MPKSFSGWPPSTDAGPRSEERAMACHMTPCASYVARSTRPSIMHLLVQCTFSKITWHEILSWCRLPMLLPNEDASFFPWWSATLDASRPSLRKGLNSLIALTAWSIWKHRNAALFDNLRPSTDELVHTIKDEARLWARAGANGLASVIPIV